MALRNRLYAAGDRLCSIVFEPRLIAMFLSLSIFFHCKPYYETLIFSFLICIILLCSISCSGINGSVVDCAADDDLVVFNSILSFHLSCKIRFEGPMRHLGREVKTSDAACKVNFYYNSAQY